VICGAELWCAVRAHRRADVRSELIPSLDLRLTWSVNGSIRHFSRYAVAY
jgi:hypothetical protein